MHQHPALLDPWSEALEMGEGTVIGLLVATEGSAYRNRGAALAIAADGQAAGAITSGCIEAELIMQATTIRSLQKPARLRYGNGSPIFDLRLPCGGAIEVLLFPLRDPDILRELAARRGARQAVSLIISAQGRLTLAPYGETGPMEDGFALGFLPPLQHVIFGTGAEPLVFTGLVAGLGHQHLLLSHDEMTLISAREMQYQTKILYRLAEITDIKIDADTAVTLFYHDHDHEPEVLRHVLQTDAFYIGAQGSSRARRIRIDRLRELGVSTEQLNRLHGPIGLIPSTRDPHTLAVSALAEIMQVAGLRASKRLPATGPLISQ